MKKTESVIEIKKNEMSGIFILGLTLAVFFGIWIVVSIIKN